MRRHLPAIAWLIIMYVATALTAGIDASPEGGLELVVSEARHVIIHALGYAVQAWLVIYALDPLNRTNSTRVAVVLMGLTLALGVGQETIQTIARQEIFPLNSLFDLVVDVGGAGVGWWVYNRWGNRKIFHSLIASKRINIQRSGR